MPVKHCTALSLLLAAALLALAGAGYVCAEDVQESLERERRRAEHAEQALQELTREERRLHADLAAVADKMEAMAEKVRQQEAVLNAIQVEEKAAMRRFQELLRDKERIMADLRGLIAELWPVHMTNLVSRGRAVETWDAADREFTWMAGVYRLTRDKLAQVRATQAEIEQALERKQSLAARARKRLEEVNQAKDELLQDKLAFRKRLANVRQRKTDYETELKEILTAIEDLNYRLMAERIPREEKAFVDLKGELPWPVEQAELAGRFRPSSSPPRRGVSLRVDKGAPVTAVSWGKVVHDDILRGFGRVIIILHGEDYYSLYAYLADSRVDVGQDVAMGDVLGTAGYHPELQAPGLYFELRFHQKAINPEGWLVARR